MNKLFKTLIYLSILLATPSMAQNITKIDSILSAYQGEHTPGASLMIIKDGKVLLKKAYGSADIEKQIPVDPTTAFRLASVTKEFTAACILILVNEGKLSLNTPLTEIFKDFPAYGRKITVKHLLTHTSGIPDYENFVADTAFNPQIKDQGALDIVMKLDSGYFEPSAKYQYSNTAYALLSLIIEKYSGMRFADFLKKRIFDPLGMSNSVAYEKGISEVKNRAYGYSKVKGAWVLRDQSSTSAVLGDGGIYTNTEDMYKWDQSLYTEKILPEKLIKEAFSYNALTNGDTVYYGYGWHLKKNSNNEEAVYHTGSSTSFRNVFYRVPSQKLSIILLTNRNQPEEEKMLTLAEKIAAQL